jgi:glycosyltransferase involved in cell wall biosynthesis
MKPLVSIITPSYNQGRFIEATIQSVLHQSYKNIEYIIIDGGSDDETKDTLQKYQSSLAYWVSEPDRGQAHAINKGIAKSKGSIIAYLNSDDLLEPDAVEAMVNAFEETPDCSLIYGKCTNIDTDGNTISEALGSHITYYELLTQKMLPKIHQPATFFNRTYFAANNPFNEQLHFAMDYELILKLVRKYPYRFIDVPIARFRYHNHSKTMSLVKNAYNEKMKVQRRLAPWLMPLWLWRYLKYVYVYVILKNY